MSYIEETLEQGEKIIYKGRLHWTFQFRYTFIGIVILAAGIAGLAYLASNDELSTETVWVITSVVALVIGLLLLIWGYFIRSKTEFAITDTRFIQKDGILNIKMTEIPLFKIETINFYQTLFDRLVGTGRIQLVGSGGTDHTVDFLQDPHEVRRILMANIKQAKATE